MIVYNITFQVDFNDSQEFVVFLHEKYVPEIEKDEMLSNVRLCRILSHKDVDSECFSLQFECESSAVLHNWYLKKGNALSNEIKSIFGNRVVGFPTMMEVII